MTDTKAALDAAMTPENQKALEEVIQGWCHDNGTLLVNSEVCDIANRIRQALTTPPAPTLMGDDVHSKSVVQAYIHFQLCNLNEGKPVDRECCKSLYDALKTAGYIRAATQPPQATDAQRMAALDAWKKYCREASYDNHYNDLQRVGLIIEAALQSPAVPRETIKKALGIAKDAIRERATDGKERAITAINTALALLGGKEG